MKSTKDLIQFAIDSTIDSMIVKLINKQICLAFGFGVNNQFLESEERKIAGFTLNQLEIRRVIKQLKHCPNDNHIFGTPKRSSIKSIIRLSHTTIISIGVAGAPISYVYHEINNRCMRKKDVEIRHKTKKNMLGSMFACLGVQWKQLN